MMKKIYLLFVFCGLGAVVDGVWASDGETSEVVARSGSGQERTTGEVVDTPLPVKQGFEGDLSNLRTRVTEAENKLQVIQGCHGQGIFFQEQDDGTMGCIAPVSPTTPPNTFTVGAECGEGTGLPNSYCHKAQLTLDWLCNRHLPGSGASGHTVLAVSPNVTALDRAGYGSYGDSWAYGTAGCSYATGTCPDYVNSVTCVPGQGGSGTEAPGNSVGGGGSGCSEGTEMTNEGCATVNYGQ